MGGSLINYALKKEKLCLEAENNISIQSRINMIVVGLPIEVQDEIDWEAVTSIEKLFIEIKKRENKYEIYKNKNKNNNDTFKKPCYMCEALGWPNRFHPTAEYKNKKLYTTKNR